MELTYQRELAELAAEMQAADSTLTPEQAVQLAREAMESLYTFALNWNRAGAAQHSVAVPSA